MKVFFQRLHSFIRDISSLKKISVILLIIVIAISYFYFTSATTKVTKSQFGGLTLDSQTIQGSKPVSQEYRAALTKADNQRVQHAKASGTSAVPTVVLPTPEQSTQVLIDDKDTNDTIKIPKLELPKTPIQLPKSTIIPPIRRVTNLPQHKPDQKTTEKISQLITNLSRNIPVASIIHFNTKTPDSLNQNLGQNQQLDSPSQIPTNVELPLIGTVYYGQLITRVNSDAPGPVLAQILQGPYRGAKLLGNFEINRDSATLRFNNMTIPQDQHGNRIEQIIQVNAVAVDTKHIGISLVSKVDRYIAEKIGFGFIAGFAQGLGNILPRLNRTTTETIDGNEKRITESVTVPDVFYSATGQAIANTGNLLFDEFGNRPRTIIVESGTEIGVLFY